MISDEQLDEIADCLKNQNSSLNKNLALDIIQALRVERKCNAVLREGIKEYLGDNDWDCGCNGETGSMRSYEITVCGLHNALGEESETRGEG